MFWLPVYLIRRIRLIYLMRRNWVSHPYINKLYQYENRGRGWWLAMLPPNALFVNFGRGNLVKSGVSTLLYHSYRENQDWWVDDLITALDKKDGLFGAALDVTDPEPLPDNHPLWTHPKVIITPHVSGNTEGEMDITVEILVENVRRLESGEGVVNEVDFSRGY